MANFLIYNKTHWLELPSKSEPEKTGYQRNHDKIQSMTIPVLDKSDKLNELDRKFDARAVLGDIVEARKDNQKMVGLEPESFVLVKVPEIKDVEAKEYTGPLLDGIPSAEYTPKILRQHKYFLDVSKIIFDAKKEAVLTKEQFLKTLSEKKV